MMIELSEDLQRFVRKQVESGRYSSEEDVIREALERLRAKSSAPRPGPGSIGAMSEAAEELDRAVAEAIWHRRLEARSILADEHDA